VRGLLEFPRGERRAVRWAEAGNSSFTFLEPLGTLSALTHDVRGEARPLVVQALPALVLSITFAAEIANTQCMKTPPSPPLVVAHDQPPALASAFDQQAAGYDADFTDSPVGRALRSMVWSRLDTLFAPSTRVLELGCGTGEDAIHLAQRGVRIVATDASREMTGVARRKTSACGCNDRVEIQALAMEDVGSALRGQLFDGTFSNFGAVNCVEDLAALAGNMASVLKPGAPLVWVIMGRHVPWEWIWYLSRAQVSKALRRYRRSGVEWRGLRIRYPRPDETALLLKTHFAITRVSPLGCVLPPSYAAGWLNRSPALFAALARIESRAQRLTMLANWSDHYILEARRL
jgi:ubiquinone/menaquinone biosynthesis C-methylase UbiE